MRTNRSRWNYWIARNIQKLTFRLILRGIPHWPPTGRTDLPVLWKVSSTIQLYYQMSYLALLTYNKQRKKVEVRHRFCSFFSWFLLKSFRNPSSFSSDQSTFAFLFLLQCSKRLEFPFVNVSSDKSYVPFLTVLWSEKLGFNNYSF